MGLENGRTSPNFPPPSTLYILLLLHLCIHHHEFREIENETVTLIKNKRPGRQPASSPHLLLLFRVLGLIFQIHLVQLLHLNQELQQNLLLQNNIWAANLLLFVFVHKLKLYRLKIN